MQELIQKLQDASEGSRELDEAIHLAVGLRPRPRLLYNKIHANILFYTTSIDAAMTLVNEYGCDLYIRASATTARCYPNEDDGVKAIAKTPALALCIAALKAQERSQ